MFSRYRDEVFAMSCPDTSEREAFFKPLFLEKATAPPPPPKLAGEWTAKPTVSWFKSVLIIRHDYFAFRRRTGGVALGPSARACQVNGG